jgi:hypothetical protein
MSELKLIDDEIGRKLAEAQKSGELQSAQSFGRPLAEDPGWNQTPEEFRMPFKILKDAGVKPPEIELFDNRARLRAQLAACHDDNERQAVQLKLSELEQRISLRLESLRIHGTL